MELKFWKNFSKKINSTKQPDEATGTIYNVYMKQGTSIEAPVFLINGIDLEYNYCKWAGHYYFIDDIIIGNNDIYEIHCTQDVLATWKSEIGESTQYIERAATENAATMTGGIIPDAMYPSLATVTHSIVNMDTAPTWQEGLYVLSFIQADPKPYYDCGIYRGGLVYAILTADQAQAVVRDIQESALSHPDVNVLSFFPSLTYIPFDTYIEPAGTTYEYVITGASNVDIPRNIIPQSIANSGIYTGFMNKDAARYKGSLPRHPQADGTGAYLDYKPFNQYTLHAGPFGDIDLPQELLSYNSTTHKFDFWMAITYDICTGDGILHILPTDVENVGNAVLRREAHIGVSLAMSEISAIGSNYAKQKYNLSRLNAVTSGIVKTATGIAVSGTPLGGILGTVETITNLQSLYYDYMQSQLPGVYTNGSNGNFADYTIPCNISHISRDILLTRADSRYGKPVNKNIRIDTLSGFIKCHSFTAEIPCHFSEYQKIEAYAVAGFYFE